MVRLTRAQDSDSLPLKLILRGETMTPDAMYWLFSTIAQTLGAIVGLIGVFSVYRIQVLRKAQEETMERTLAARKIFFGLSATGQSQSQFYTRWGEIDEANKQQHPEQAGILNRAIDDLTLMMLSRDLIIINFRLFLTINLMTIFASVLALPYCVVLVRLSTWTIIGTLVVFAVCMILTVRLSFSLIPR
jgi:hypothetical protein